MLRIIRELQPRWVVGENVLGLVNWDGGLVFEEVQSDLESQGYEVQPYVLPACAVNAPHRRDRVWFVAYSKLRSAGQDRNSDKAQRGRHTAIHPQGQSGDGKAILDSGLCGLQGATPDAPDIGLQQPRGAWERWAGFTHNGSVPDWGNFPQTQPTICTGDDGLSTQLDGITFSKWRNESIKAAGNAIVPQVAYQIFRAIELYEIQNGAK